MAGDDDEIEAVIPTEFADCVSCEDLEATCKRMEEKMDETVHKSVHDAIITMDLGTILDRLDKQMTELVNRVATLETRPPQQQPLLPQQQPPPRAFLLDDAVVDACGNYDEAATRDGRLRRRLRRNMVGMGDNQRGSNTHVPDDPYAKIKFSIPPFSGRYDATAYLDWEMTVEQKFASYLVPEHHQVREATSEFKDFAIVWWTSLVGDGREPTT
jgi:hypothetical protein